MAKVTSKLQVTIPKAIAQEYGIAPGDEIDFQSAGPQIRVIPRREMRRARLSLAERLRLFDESRARQREREKSMKLPARPPADRGWTREELYSTVRARDPFLEPSGEVRELPPLYES